MTTITLIVEKCMADIFHVYANLMGTPRLQSAFHQGDVSQSFQHTIMGDCGLTLVSLRENPHLHPIFRVTPNVPLDASLILPHDAPHQCPVFALRGLVKELQAEVALRFRAFGYHQ